MPKFSCRATILIAASLMVLQCPVEGVRRSDAVRKMIAARNLEAAGLPDPKCHTGVIAMKEKGKPQVCCAGYCGECSDYPTCMSVRGQNSTFACCKTQVFERRCGSAPANVCLKKCSEAVPPCIMEKGGTFTTPDPSARTAGEDCNKAVADWRKKVAAATEPKKL
eukprot:CAMPEP_0172779580 /NCGR_PEP_ID=MMETSP1074-20121228/202493_1 /TAXON_ID=2916 /ORGANISM="Ceratium fusus, Strain PA161109" /LENGTH=164 /DNA_ID=CAMNT_0013616543 /DNA_START=481 /DNA_END=975 /DNA_ORIENTATION=+